ncbi:MAG: Ca2+-binding protein toxin [Bacteroidetes bacterium]|jgi:hypothetical protein|nr:Ca2+-binding protein toxin [Bacteroidota bacterium]
MKKLYSLLLVLIFLSGKHYAQTIQWATTENGPNTAKKIFCDKDSNVYIYGNKALAGIDPYTFSPDTSGSYLEKFSAQGNLVLYKRWNGIRFYIQDYIYDGNQSFYFTGFFAGSFTIDGITITSKGNLDGMIGKMNTNGTILWINTFGSSQREIGQGICLNSAKTSLIITGSTTDSLVVNNTYIDKSTQSALVAKFSLSGILQSHKLHDFLPQRDNVYGTEEGLGNVGKEIKCDMAGNYYILTDREGKHPPCCSSDTLDAALEGRYVTKLNASLDTIWSHYVIGPNCYYGWESHGLAVSANGDPYITGYCSSHYGGTGFVDRLNQNTGVVAWNEDRTDGGFGDITTEGNNLFTCGTDSANYCPCPDSHQGYQTLKKFDQSNTMVQLMKFNGSKYEDLRFDNITRDGFGDTYLLGTFYSSMTVIGTDTLYSSFPASQGRFVMKLSDNATSTAIARNESGTSFYVYPNPSNGIVEIHYSGNGNENARFNVVDIMGRTIHSDMLPKGTNTKTIDLSKEAKGLYMIEVFSEKGKNYKKLVIE